MASPMVKEVKGLDVQYSLNIKLFWNGIKKK